MFKTFAVFLVRLILTPFIVAGFTVAAFVQAVSMIPTIVDPNTAGYLYVKIGIRDTEDQKIK